MGVNTLDSGKVSVFLPESVVSVSSRESTMDERERERERSDAVCCDRASLAVSVVFRGATLSSPRGARPPPGVCGAFRHL